MTEANVTIAQEIPMKDVALGLTLLCGPAHGTNAELDAVNSQLAAETHETVFARAFLIAQMNNRKLFGRTATYDEFMQDFDGRDALFFSMPGDAPVVGALCGGRMLCPNEELSPDKSDKPLFVLTAIGLATAGHDPEDDEPYVEPTVH